jgi:uncharacterized phage protein (TIGR02218 family)
MKVIPIALAEHRAGDTTTLARCWKVTRLDGQVFGFTNHDQDLMIDSVPYVASTGFTASAITTKADLSVDASEATGLLDDERITNADLEAGKWDGAAIEVFEVNWTDPAAGKMYFPGYKLGNITAGRGSWNAEVRGLAQALQHSVGEAVTGLCQAVFGDERCKVDVEALRETGDILQVISQRRFITSGLTATEGYFKYGLITFTSGENAGISVEVAEYVNGDTFDTSAPLPRPIAVGDTFTAIPGCNHVHRLILDPEGLTTAVEGDCKNRYNNTVNFRGFPTVPGPDRMLGDANYE